MLRTSRFAFFFGKDDPLSNWHPSVFTYHGVTFGCMEQFMMFAKAMRFDDKAAAARILAATDPRSQKAIGREVRGFDELRWKARAPRIVFAGLCAKYRQNPPLLSALLDTAPTELVEASPSDRIWGIGLAARDPASSDRTKWRGQNLLGRLSTRARDELAGLPTPDPFPVME